jgi:hypothetical protein
VFVGVFFLWRQPLFHGPCPSSLALVTAFGLFRCVGDWRVCVPLCLSLFLVNGWLFAPIAYHVYCLTYCVLVSCGPVIFASRSRVSVWLQSCLT